MTFFSTVRLTVNMKFLKWQAFKELCQDFIRFLDLQKLYSKTFEVTPDT